MDESDLENGRKEREKRFFERMERDVIDVNEDISMINSRGQSLFQSTFVRFHGRYGLFVSHGGTLKEMDNLQEDIDEYLPFIDDFSKHKSEFVIPFLIEGGILFLYDDWDKMNEHYDQIGKHGVDGNPFFARTFEDNGVPLKENT